MPVRLLTAIVMAALVACAVLPVRAGDAPGLQSPLPAEPVATVEGVSEYRLANGLRVLLLPDPSQSTVLVNMTYLAGSRHESYGATGMAHLVEHLMFKGSAAHPDIPGEVAAHGAAVKAGTQYDRTSYLMRIPADEATVDWALALEADRMVNATLAKEDLASEMTVVRNEYERNDDVSLRVLKERMRSVAYQWHNYGNAMIGARSDLEQVPIERVREFHRTWYRPDNAVLLLAGGFEQERMLEQVERAFASVERPGRPLPRLYTLEPAQDGEREVVLRRIGEGGVAMVGYHVPAAAHPDFAAVSLLGRLLADRPSGVLHRELVENGLADSVMLGSLNPPLRDPFMLSMVANVGDADAVAPAREALVRSVEGMADAPPDAAEVERTRDRMLAQIEGSLRSPQRAAQALGDWAAAGDWRLLYVHRDRLREVTPEDVQRVAAAYLRPANRTVALFVPAEAPMQVTIPATPDVAGLVEGYAGDRSFEAVEAFDYSPGNAEARTTRLDIGGLKLALLPKPSRGDSVHLKLTLRFGDERGLQGKSAVAEVAGNLLMHGTRQRTQQDISDELARLRSTATVLGGTASATADVRTSREQLGEVLALVAEVLREPAFEPGAFRQVRQSRLSRLARSRGHAGNRAGRLLRHHLQPYPEGDPRHVGTVDEEMAALRSVTLDQVRRFHADFYGASHGELAVVGDFDPDALVERVRQLFGDWPSRAGYTPITYPYAPVPKMARTLAIPGVANAAFQAAMNIDIGDDQADWAALSMAGELLGGGFVNSRLATRLRQQEGVSYSVQARFTPAAPGRPGRFFAAASAAPENMARLEAAFDEEIERALEHGFSQEELDTARSGWLQRRRLARGSDAALAGRLSGSLARDRTLAWESGFEQRVRELTAADVGAVLRRHLDPELISRVRAGDLDGEAGPPAASQE